MTQFWMNLHSDSLIKFLYMAGAKGILKRTYTCKNIFIYLNTVSIRGVGVGA